MDKREAFETWARRELGWESGEFIRSGDAYRHSCTQYAWEIWQAALTPSPWIPCSERLPTAEDNPVLVATRLRNVFEASLYDTDWVYDSGIMPCSDVTHWMPMPEPPEVEA